MALEAEVGPVKYIAELIYDAGGSEVNVGDAVRLIIIVIIFVFDPLAIMMVICATSTLSFLSPRPRNKEGDSPNDIEEDFCGVMEEKKKRLEI